MSEKTWTDAFFSIIESAKKKYLFQYTVYKKILNYFKKIVANIRL